jgi:hypothetical protein
MLRASERGAESELAILGLGSVRGGASPGGTMVGATWRPRRVSDRRRGGITQGDLRGEARGTQHWVAIRPRKRVSLGQVTMEKMGGFRLLRHLQHGVGLLLTVCQAGPQQLRGLLDRHGGRAGRWRRRSRVSSGVCVGRGGFLGSSADDNKLSFVGG